MSENLHIVRIKTPARVLPYYYVRESKTRGRDILALGHDKDVQAAYARCMRDYLKASQRLQAFEAILPYFTPGASQRA